MAYDLPRSRFVGIDLSERQIDDAREFAAAVGVANIELLALDIRASADELADRGPFDFIIAHGIYSWAPDPVKDAILATCRRLLAPQGIAYVSYNCYPGCQTRGMLRQMCQYHGRNSAGPREYAAATREFLGLLNTATAAGDTPYRAAVRQQVGDLTALSDEVLLHDDLEGDNDPRFFHEFMAHAGEHQLKYLADAYFAQMFGLGIDPAALERVRHAGDRLAFEQYLDFLYGRSLRTTLLCDAAAPISGEVDPAAIRSLWIVSDAKPVATEGTTEAQRHRNDEAVTFKGADCTLAVTTPIAKAALLELAEAAPRPMRFTTLVERVERRLATKNLERELIDLAIEWFATRLIEFTAYCVPVAVSVDERPTASAVARMQAARGWGVTSLFHRRIRVDGELATRVLQCLDGSHDRAALIEALLAPVAKGAVQVRIDGENITDPDRVRPILAERVDACLADFLEHGLLRCP
jgi:methyltransferase-like protein